MTRAHRYEPDVNATYAEMAAHYGLAVIPARPRKPRDKAKVEAGVLLAERWILARLRNRRFSRWPRRTSAIGGLRGGDQRAAVPQDARLAPSLVRGDGPAGDAAAARHRYEFASWRIGLQGQHRLPRRVRAATTTPCPTSWSERVSTCGPPPRRSRSSRRRAGSLRICVTTQPGRHTTDPAHMPVSHRRHAEWSPSRILSWAARTGPATAGLADAIMQARPHPEQGYRSCLGLIRLADRYGAERVEAACARALAVRALSYRSVESILRHGLDRQPLPAGAGTHPPPHPNLRGASYYR